MTIEQQNYEFLKDVAKHLDRWSRKPTLLVLSVSSLTLMILVGGLFFWASQIGPVFGSNDSSNRSELEVARSGLQTMKRMAGDQQAWAQSIKEEYNRLLLVQNTNSQFIDYSYNYNANFIGVGTDYPTNQALTK